MFPEQVIPPSLSVEVGKAGFAGSVCTSLVKWEEGEGEGDGTCECDGADLNCRYWGGNRDYCEVGSHTEKISIDGEL